MARVFGIQGNVVGKIANTVYAVVKGVNVARTYNGSPANPQTAAQVSQRAKMKLMSQISAAVAPAIAFPRQGLVSARNNFVKANIAGVTYTEQTESATFDYAAMDLTGGVLGLPAPYEASRTGDTLGVALDAAAENIDVVFYMATIVQSDGSIRIVGPIRVDNPGSEGNFPYTITNVPHYAVGYILAYGMRFNNDDARTKYESIHFTSDACNLSVIRQILENNFTLSRTVSAPFEAGQ